MKSLIFFFISVISFTNATEASMKFERMDSNGWCSRGSKPKAPSPSYTCYKFIETNDGDPSVIFDMRTLHGSLNEIIPNKTLSRYTLRVAKEDSKISYDGDWTSLNYRKAMKDSGYKNGDTLGGEMFPILYENY